MRKGIQSPTGRWDEESQWVVAPRERAADVVVHLVGLILGCAGCVVLAVVTPLSATPGQRAALVVYAAGILGMLGSSAAYHLCREPCLKLRLRRLDHAAIFLMIAGTYTGILAFGSTSGRASLLLTVVWVVASVGMVIKIIALRIPEWLSVTLYLVLGWTILVDPREIVGGVSPFALALLALGGVLYSAGTIFYACERLPFHTAIWHGFVLLAAMCQFFAVVDTIPA